MSRNITQGKVGRRISVRLLAFLLIVFAGSLILLVPRTPALTIRDAQTNRLVFAKPVDDSDNFGIRWIHSIHLTPVEEHYEVQGDQLVLVGMSFRDYGIGMDNELAPGETMHMRNGSFFIENMNRPYPVIRLFIGQVRANHTLLLGGGEIPLNSLGSPGSAVTIQVERLSLFEQVRGINHS